MAFSKSSYKWSEEKIEEKRDDTRKSKLKMPTHPIRILAVGCSGVGKSTIGNLMLKDEFTGIFKTAGSAESVTKVSQTERNGRFVYVDVPGIPDTKMSKTKQFYNMIVEEAKKEVNVIIFVFKFERIDERKFKMCKLLFRELTRSNASKILIINDMRARGLGGAKVDEKTWAKDMQVLSDKIEDLTCINFHGPTIAINCDNMQAKIKKLRLLMEKDPPAVKNPHLRTFDDLVRFKDDMRSEEARQKEIVAEANRKAKDLQKRVNWAQNMVVLSGVGSSAVAGAGYVATLAGYLGSSTVTASAAAAIAGWGAGHGMMAETLKADIKEAKATMKKGSKARSEAARQLAEAVSSFEKLSEVLAVSTTLLE